MVLVEDVSENASGSTSNNQGSTENTSNPTSSSSSSSSASSNPSPVMNFIMQDKIGAVLYLTRIFTIVCTLFFLIPLSGYDANTLYQKALMGCAATSALKLHQRMAGVPFQLNRVYFGHLTTEDSFHYLLFALIFLNNFPVTVALMAPTGFALLHVVAYTKSLLDLTGGSFSILRNLVDTIFAKNQDIMKFVAVNEILLAPTIVFMIFSGKSGIFVPFIYYRFICMRYQSRRNPHCRQMFFELRHMLEFYTGKPGCPVVVRNVAQRLISLLLRLAPQPTAA